MLTDKMKANIILAKIKMIEDGILPAITSRELSKMLSGMPNKEKRIAQRKFRKVWRKLARQKECKATMRAGELYPAKSTIAARSARVSIYYIRLQKINT